MDTSEVDFTGKVVPDSDKRAVLDVPGRLDAAWNDRNAREFAEIFTADASFRIHSGEWVIGQENIESFWRDIVFPNTTKGTRHEITPTRVHFVSQTVALGDGILQLVDRSKSPPEVQVNAAGTLVLLKQDSHWLVMAVRLASLAVPAGQIAR